MVEKDAYLFRGRDGDCWEVMSQESAYGSEDYDLDGEQRLRDLDELRGDDLPEDSEEADDGDFDPGELSDSEEELEPPKDWVRDAARPPQPRRGQAPPDATDEAPSAPPLSGQTASPATSPSTGAGTSSSMDHSSSGSPGRGRGSGRRGRGRGRGTAAAAPPVPTLSGPAAAVPPSTDNSSSSSRGRGPAQAARGKRRGL